MGRAGAAAQTLAMVTTMNETGIPGGEPPRAPPPQPNPFMSAKRIYRDPSGPVAGVAGGFAAYFGVDPVLSRLMWIAAMFSGVGFPAYIVCWLVIPKAKSWPPPGYDRPGVQGPPGVWIGGPGQSPVISGLIIVALAVFIGSGMNGIGRFLLPAMLIGFGVYLLNQRAGAPSAAAAATASPTSASSAAASSADDADSFDPLDDSSPDPDYRPAWRRDVESWTTDRSRLVTPTVLSLLAIGAGAVIALNASGLAHISFTAAAAGGLVIVGGGLLASLWLGRAHALVPVGLGLVGVMLAGNTIGGLYDAAQNAHATVEINGESDGKELNHVNNAVGDQYFTPATLEELQPEYNLGVGKLTLDLTKLDFTGQDRDLDVRVGMGEAIVIVPAKVAVEARGDVGMGEAIALGKKNGGMGVTVTQSDDTPDAGAGKLNIDFKVGLGKGEVRHAAAQ